MGLEVALALGFTGIGATAIGGAVNLAAALGIGYAANRLSGKNAKTAAGTAGGSAVSLVVAADAPRVAILGEAATAGSLVYFHAEGPDNGTQCRVIALADHECDGLTAIVVNGVRKSVSPDGTVPGFNGKLRVRFYAGAPGQLADADVIAGSGGLWTADHRGVGICYAVVWADFDETLFPNDFPSVVFVVRGAVRLVDPRTGLTGYSDNWGVCVYNLLRGITQTATGPHLVGLNAPASSIRAADAIAACNVSDEAVPLAAGGTEPRYRVGVVLSTDQTARQQLEAVLAAGGDVIESGGIYRILADVAASPVAALTDADLILSEPSTWSPRAPRSRLVNTIEATWLAPASNYAATPLPPRTSSADRAADGGIRLAKSLDLSAVPSRSQAQRVMEIARRQARRQGTATFVVKAAWCVLEVGDWISVTSARFGWVDRTFVVLASPQAEGMTAALSLAEVDAGLDDWGTADELGEGAAVDLSSGAPGAPTVGGLALTSYTSEGPSGSQRPGLRLAWTPVTDRTVVSFRVQYRRVGADETPSEVAVADPFAGAFSWVTGVQGGAIYEARVLPITAPVRAADWSAWVAVTGATATPTQVVPVAAMALNVDPALIPPASLNAQDECELRLVTALRAVRGSVAERWEANRQQIKTLSEALGEMQAMAWENDTFIRREEVTRRDNDEALARVSLELGARLDHPSTGLAAQSAARQVLEGRVTTAEGALTTQGTALTNLQSTVAGKAAASAVDILQTRVTATESGISASAVAITTLETEVDGASTSISQILSSVDGNQKFALVVSNDGRFVTVAEINSDAEGFNSLAFALSELTMYDPLVDSGTPTPFLRVASVGGVSRFIFDGDILSRTLESGTIKTGYIQDPTNTFFFDFTNGKFGRTDGKMLYDLKNLFHYMDAA